MLDWERLDTTPLPCLQFLINSFCSPWLCLNHVCHSRLSQPPLILLSSLTRIPPPRSNSNLYSRLHSSHPFSASCRHFTSASTFLLFNYFSLHFHLCISFCHPLSTPLLSCVSVCIPALSPCLSPFTLHYMALSLAVIWYASYLACTVSALIMSFNSIMLHWYEKKTRATNQHNIKWHIMEYK